MQLDHLIQTIAIAAIPILFAITLHEAAHGYVARYFGDMTAYQQGRISLNPIRHIDPVGTILLPMLTLWLGGILFGWAKPVPVNFSALRNPKKDMLWVALAGPAANLFMVVCWVFILKMALSFPESYFYKPLEEMAKMGVQINVILMALNLLPLPPLDGGRIAVSLLPHRQAYLLARIEPYGLFILIFLAMTPLLGWILRPAINLVYGVIRLLIGL
ncbi:MAG: site-2 protease family protein [Nitrosomonadales bacterium]|nr:site-2 protease family protein [Nitrosomonadales bacterium]